MTRRPHGLRALAVLGASLALATTAPPRAVAAAGGATFDGAGWWWRAQTGVLELPAPPSVPEGGLVVSAAPDGAAAVAAVRFRVPAEATDLTLRLEVADERGLGAGVVACAATDRWFPTQAGGWEQRPRADCDRGEIVGVATDDGTAWILAALAPLRRGTVLDLVLLPAPDNAAGVATFELVFHPPDDAALAVVLPVTGDDADAIAGPRPVAPRADVATRPESRPGGAVGGLIVPPAPPPLAVGPQVTPPLGPQVAPPRPQDPGRAVAHLLAPVSRPRAAESPLSPRTVGLLAALCTAVTAVDIRRRPTPAPRRIGSRDSAPGRGIGRFVRPREGSPVPLL